MDTNRKPSQLIISSTILALGLAVGGVGGATASALITGRQIKDGTVTTADIRNNNLKSADVRDGSLLVQDLAASTRTALRGARGPAGAPGAAGTSTAFGRVNGFNTPGFESKSSNVVGITRRAGYSGGAYCIEFSSAIPPERLASAVASGYYAGTMFAAPWLGCPAGQLGIGSFNTSNSFSDNAFTFVVP